MKRHEKINTTTNYEEHHIRRTTGESEKNFFDIDYDCRYRKHLYRMCCKEHIGRRCEMCVQIILPQLKDPFEMLITIEYSEEHNDADVIVRYDGEAFDPTHTDNELSLLLAKKATVEIQYQYAPEEKLSNIVNAQI